MYHADEVRDFQQVPKGDTVKVSEKEVELGVGLIDRLTSEGFNPESYKDEYRIRVLAILDEKSKGQEVIISAPAPQRGGKVVDIMEALSAAWKESGRRKNPRLLVPLRRKKDCHKPETNRLDHSGFTARESVPSEVLVRSLHPSHATSFDIPSFSLTFSTH
jgi:hypothetical protein